MIRGLIFLILAGLSAPVLADSRMDAAPYAYVQLKHPAKERQAKDLMATIRCLVCQGQSIADSDAEMAGDMRSLIRERIQKGEKPEAIRAWLVERYGDFVLYRPGVKPLTWVLWFGPFLLLLLALTVLARLLRARRQASPPLP